VRDLQLGIVDFEIDSKIVVHIVFMVIKMVSLIIVQWSMIVDAC